MSATSVWGCDICEIKANIAVKAGIGVIAGNTVIHA